MTQHKAWERRIADLEARQRLVVDVLFALADKVEPEGVEFALLALLYGFTAEDLDSLDQFWKWAVNQGSEKLTREAFVREFERRMPRPVQGKLEQILRAHKADGQFSSYYQLVLGQQNDAEEQ